MASAQADDAPAIPWHAAYPSPRDAQLKSLTREQVLEMLKSGASVLGKDFLLIDVRRNDHEGGAIRGSVNLPAQSLYLSIPTLYAMFKAAGVRTLIWYCSSSRGRGTRAAGWFGDYLADHGDREMQSVILFEGIKGWATAGHEYTEWMDEYDASKWAQ